MDARLLYDQLLDEITEDERSLQRKRDLAAFLRARIDSAQAKSAQPAAASAQPPRSLMTMPELTTAAREVIDKNGLDEFVVGTVNRWLVTAGWTLPDSANSKITVILKRLFDEGVLERTFEGAGNVPHKYRLARQGQAATSAAAVPTADPAGS